MNNLAQSEVFSLTLVIGTYLASLALYRKTRISLLHPLITSIFVIIVVLKTMDIEYESFQKGSHLIHFLFSGFRCCFRIKGALIKISHTISPLSVIFPSIPEVCF